MFFIASTLRNKLRVSSCTLRTRILLKVVDVIAGDDRTSSDRCCIWQYSLSKHSSFHIAWDMSTKATKVVPEVPDLIKKTNNLWKKIFISQHSFSSIHFCFDTLFIVKTPQNIHQSQIPPIHCWQIIYHRAILDWENNPRMEIWRIGRPRKQSELN